MADSLIFSRALNVFVNATATIVAGKPVTFAGAVAAAGSSIAGVASTDAGIGDSVPLIILGTVNVTADGAVSAGDDIEVGTSGAYRTLSSGVKIGRALTSASGGATFTLFVLAASDLEGVSSFNGRTGAVAPTSGDYAFSQLSGTASLAQLPTGIPNSNLANSSITITAGTGMSGGGTAALGGTVTLNNNGVTSFNGRGGAVSPTSGDYTAAQVTNAVSSASTYNDPPWLTGLAGSKITGFVTGNIKWSGSVPITHTSPGTAGDLAYDGAGNLYLCFATNSWAKFAPSSTTF